jgi:hypothetical protein
MTTAPQVSAQPTRYERQPPLATDSKITATPWYRTHGAGGRAAILPRPQIDSHRLQIQPPAAISS